MNNKQIISYTLLRIILKRKMKIKFLGITLLKIEMYLIKFYLERRGKTI